ncbi:MAG: Endonuclease V [candidate division WS2 bacterium]|uniref:Endonuclease V n=1 Tax=Psychracetigena formicireducens TaxID=2986056 RepID=A0A9E2BGR3_PSYF1|nr:Endonuclease V [Candidatus Psychracetigena formicireducens]MBT9150317.1 Endonuclease V [Candidatus Psychracetigena formicireducens]
MRIPELNELVSVKEAREIQEILRKEVITIDSYSKPIKNLLAMDVSYLKAGDELGAVALLYSYPELNLLEESFIRKKSTFPYIPGLLAFRELPPLLEAIKGIKAEIDMLLVEGQGIAHPKRFGLASHLGVLLDTPSIGCAKSLLWGKHSGVEKCLGSYSYLLDQEDIIGIALRTRAGARPIYVSQGHKVSLDTAREIVMSLVKTFRLPEPLRTAHIKSKLLMIGSE